MEINFHLRSTQEVGRAFAARTNVRQQARVAEQDVALENSRALKTALDNTPTTRADVVQRATEKVGDAHYPPPETIRMISNLLAIKLDEEPEES
jgi:hypothetical protein